MLRRPNLSCWSIMKTARLKVVAVCSNVELRLRQMRDSSQGPLLTYSEGGGRDFGEDEALSVSSCEMI
jgi:hypothetical protein